jgi:hypothetical protein
MHTFARFCSVGAGRSRVLKTATFVPVLLMLVPGDARAQELAGLIKHLFDLATINAPSPNPANPALTIAHQPHFIVGENLKLTTREVNVALASQLASFPLPSSSGGFTFSVNDRGEVTPTSTNFGPSFAERGVTIGRKQLNFGVTFQATSYDSFEGINLDSNQLSFIREHNDCCPAGQNNPSAATNFNPEFERDLLRSNLSASIDSKTTAFFANYGVSNRFDIGIAVPIVSVQMDATVNAEILRTASSATPFVHSFDGLGSSTASFSDSGSATGIGDILLRAKYNFLRTSTAALAGALDLRLPTGDKDNLLGTGATQTKLFFVASGEYGRVSPHVNVGYTFSNGETSSEATSFDLDPAQFALSTVPGFAPNEVDLSVPDEFNYTLGLSVAAHSRVTLGFDMYGRTLRDVPRFALENNTYPNRGAGALPSASFTANNEFSVESTKGNLNILLGVVGGKINLGGTFLLNVTVLFPMSDGGLKPNPTPVIGFDYVF